MSSLASLSPDSAAADPARTLYVTDLDGTLLGSDSRVSEESARIINWVVGQGALFTVATARTPATVVPLLSDVATSAPAIVMTGAALWDRPACSFLDARAVAPGEVDVALETFRASGVAPFAYAYAPDGARLEVYHPAPTLNRVEEAFVQDRRGLELKRFHLATPLPARARRWVALLFGMGPIDGLRSAAAALTGALGRAVGVYHDIFNPGTGYCEVFPAGVSKAQAMLTVAARAGAGRVVAFGDNLNDVPMLRAATVGVAVENAYGEVRRAADVVIGCNCDAAVARWILQDWRSRGHQAPSFL